MAIATYSLTLTQANIDNGHIYLTDCVDVFPADTLGGANSSEAARRTVEIQCGSETVHTDIDREKRIFRQRSWVRHFFKENRVTASHRVLLEQLGPYSYRVSKERCMPITCLSIQQPWADLIMDRKKQVENRSRSWTEAMQNLETGQIVRLGIHVSSGLTIWDSYSAEKRENLATGWSEADATNGGSVIGVVDVLQISKHSSLPTQLQRQNHKFTDDEYQWHWVLGKPRKLVGPFRAKGNSWLFHVDIPHRLLPAELRKSI